MLAQNYRTGEITKEQFIQVDGIKCVEMLVVGVLAWGGLWVERVGRGWWVNGWNGGHGRNEKKGLEGKNDQGGME